MSGLEREFIEYETVYIVKCEKKDGKYECALYQNGLRAQGPIIVNPGDNIIVNASLTIGPMKKEEEEIKGWDEW